MFWGLPEPGKGRVTMQQLSHSGRQGVQATALHQLQQPQVKVQGRSTEALPWSRRQQLHHESQQLGVWLTLLCSAKRNLLPCLSPS